MKECNGCMQDYVSLQCHEMAIARAEQREKRLMAVIAFMAFLLFASGVINYVIL